MMPSMTARPEVAKLFSKHHIGGRFGNGGFPSVPELHGSLASTFYEADASCCPQIEAKQAIAGYAEVQVIQKCIGLSGKTISFNLNYDPLTSSVLDLNPRYKHFYYDSGRFDYDYRCAMSPVRQIQMSTVSLDDIETRCPIDFLSLDTQGSELEILKGAVGSLANAVGVETEVSFRQIYENGPLFGDICSFLNTLGFEFIYFTSLTSAAPRSMRLPGRARKMQTFGDALFLRSPDKIDGHEQRKKLIFAALAYGQVEYAAHCVKGLGLGAHSDSLPGTPDASLRIARTWTAFVDEFIGIVSRQGNIQQPPTFSEIMSVEESFSRFDSALALPRKSDFHPFRALKSLLRGLPQSAKTSLIRIANIHSVAKYCFGRSSELEALFQGVGLSGIKRELRMSRFRRIFPLSGL